jgi:hypothetical protein
MGGDGMMIGINEMLMFALNSDVEHSLSVAMKLMAGKSTCKHNCGRCICTLSCRADDFDYSKKVYFIYENEEGIKRDLVAHFYIQRNAFVFIMAFTSDD